MLMSQNDTTGLTTDTTVTATQEPSFLALCWGVVVCSPHFMCCVLRVPPSVSVGVRLNEGHTIFFPWIWSPGPRTGQ